MNITRHNYEEFFILYMDNELNQEERSQVALFVQAHPDLAEELAMLQQSKLIPDNELVYDNKESLMRAGGLPLISLNNYEEWLLLYVDNELGAEEKMTVEKFVSLNPAARQELDLLQKATLQPERVIYFNKESLYRKEEKERRVIPAGLWRLAAAAVLLFVIGTSAFFIFNNADTGKPPRATAKNNNEKKIAAPIVPVQKNNQAVEPVITNPDNDLTATTVPKENAAKQSQTIKENKIIIPQKQSITKTPIEEPVIAAVTDNNTGNLPVFKHRRDLPGDKLIAVAALTPLTNHTEIEPRFAVTLPDPQSYNNTDDQPEKRSKLRGLLRKVTRTFEKTTNIKATDENDRLLVAGLAIQL